MREMLLTDARSLKARNVHRAVVTSIIYMNGELTLTSCRRRCPLGISFFKLVCLSKQNFQRLQITSHSSALAIFREDCLFHCRFQLVRNTTYPALRERNFLGWRWCTSDVWHTEIGVSEECKRVNDVLEANLLKIIHPRIKRVMMSHGWFSSLMLHLVYSRTLLLPVWNVDFSRDRVGSAKHEIVKYLVVKFAFKNRFLRPSDVAPPTNTSTSFRFEL